jgi:hypothetical protein
MGWWTEELDSPSPVSAESFKSVWDVKFKTLLHLIPDLRMYRSIPLFPILLHDVILGQITVIRVSALGTAMWLRIPSFWDMISHHWPIGNRSFGGTLWVQLQGLKAQEE